MIDVDAIHRAAQSPMTVATMLGLKIGRGSRDDRVLVLCPWHEEKNPACVLARKGSGVVAYCHACHQGGDIFALVGAVHGLDPRLDFRRVAELAAGLVGVPIDSDTRPRRTSIQPRDPAIDLARRIAMVGDDWACGRTRIDKKRDIDFVPDDPIIMKASRAEVLAAMRALETADALEDQGDVIEAELQRLADDHDTKERAYVAMLNRWDERPHYDGPIHLASEGRPPPAYYEYRKALKATGWISEDA